MVELIPMNTRSTKIGYRIRVRGKPTVARTISWHEYDVKGKIECRLRKLSEISLSILLKTCDDENERMLSNSGW